MELRKKNNLPNIDPNNLFKTWKAQIEAILKHNHLYDIAIGIEKIQDKTEAELKPWKRRFSRCERIIKSTLNSKVLENLWLLPENNYNFTLYEKICHVYDNIPKTTTSLFNPLIFNYKIVYTLELLKQCMDDHKNEDKASEINGNKVEDIDITIPKPELRNQSQSIKKKIKHRRKRRRHFYQPYRKYLKFRYIK